MTAALPWLVYRRLRPAMGTSFAFVLMYAALVQVPVASLFLIAIGFMLLHLFSDCFNDYYDIDFDRKNKRNDKLILSGIISPKALCILSFVFLLAGIGIIGIASPFMLLPALWCALLSFSYSYPRVRLKNYNLLAYMLGGSVWVFVFYMLEMNFFGGLSGFGSVFILFAFSQFVFILCQKDSTDKKDDTNLFLYAGSRKSSLITAFFGMLSSLSLLFMSVDSAPLFIFWMLNLASKAVLIEKIRAGTITRPVRSRLVLAEFLTPYLYVGGGLLA